MRQLFILISISILLLSCGEGESSLSDNEFVINGKVNFLREGYVKVKVRKNESVITLDSAQVADDSTFTLRGIIESPQYAQIDFFGKQMDIFPLTGGSYELLADGNRNGGKFEISGTDEVDLHNALIARLQAKQEVILEERQKLTYAMANQDEASAEELRGKLLSLLEKQNEEIKAFVDSLGTSNLVAGYAMLNYLNPVEHFEYFDAKVKEIEAKDAPTDFEIQFISQFNNKRDDIIAAIESNRIKEENEAKLAIGKVFPNIKLPNPNGQEKSLEDMRGNIVLVDFWAGWCRPCRMENPNLVKAYAKYNKSGFEIFGVSLDRTKDQWTGAIADDGLTWTQVSDLQYWNSAVVKEFGITGIPANFLLDREGKIIAKNLRGEALEAKLSELM